MDLNNPLLRHLDAVTPEFLRSKGFDISTKVGCIAALQFLSSARVEEAFWEDPSSPNYEQGQDGAGTAGGDEIRTAADWYIGEARLDGMRRIVENRLHILMCG